VASGSSPKSGSAAERWTGVNEHPVVKLSTVVATFLAIATGVLALTDRDEVARPELDSRRERASAIAACQERHRLERSVEWRSKDGERVIASCTWPPRRWTDADVYSEVTFEQVEGPGYEEGRQLAQHSKIT
jgi:hypothetical protein